MTRLNNEIRSHVQKEMLKHRFADAAKELLLDFVEFAEAVYNDIYNKSDRAKMAALPAGWLLEAAKIGVQFGAGCSYIDLRFSGSLDSEINHLLESWKNRPNVTRRVWRKHEYNCAKVYHNDHKLSIRYQMLKTRHADLIKDHQAAKKVIESALAATASVEKLLDLWPESKPFLTPYLNKKPQLPSIPVGQLNTLLDLPV